MKPQKDDLSMGNLHVVINGRDQGPVRTGIRIDDLQTVEKLFRGRMIYFYDFQENGCVLNTVDWVS